MDLTYTRGSVLKAFIGALVAVGLPMAVSASVPDVIFSLAASNASGTAQFSVSGNEVLQDRGSPDYFWELTSAIPLIDPSTEQYVATLLYARIEVVGGTGLDFTAVVLAGESTTTFTMDPPSMDFDPITAGSAALRASATITVSDLDGNFARALGVGTPGSGMFRGFYNGTSPATGTSFTGNGLVGLVFAGTGGVSTGTENRPAWGYTPVEVELGNMNSAVGIILTPNDLSEIVSVFEGVGDIVCPIGDIDRNGTVDPADLSLLLSGWGSSQGNPGFDSALDLDGDGNVGAQDLATLLAHWGDCSPE